VEQLAEVAHATTPARRTAASNTWSASSAASGSAASSPTWLPDLSRITGLMRAAERRALMKRRAWRIFSTWSRM
jgi:hypothetical protein